MRFSSNGQLAYAEQKNPRRTKVPLVRRSSKKRLMTSSSSSAAKISCSYAGISQSHFDTPLEGVAGSNLNPTEPKSSARHKDKG